MAASWPIVCSTCIQHQNNPNYQIIYFKLYTSNVFPFFPFFWYFSYIYTNRNYGDYGVQLLSSKYLTSSTQIDTLNLFFIPVHVELLLDVKYFAPGMHSSSVLSGISSVAMFVIMSTFSCIFFLHCTNKHQKYRPCC